MRIKELFNKLQSLGVGKWVIRFKRYKAFIRIEKVSEVTAITSLMIVKM